MAEDREKSSGRNDSWNEFNELTLNVMANHIRYDKCKKSMANTSQALAEMFNTEKQYYKERILAMTRGLFDEKCENDEMNRAHQEYLKACIEYLKWNDITDMVEEDTRSEVRDVLKTDTQTTSTSTSRSVSPRILAAPARSSSPSPEPEPEEPVAASSAASSVLSFANKMCIRKKSMDDFIVIRPSEENSDEKIQARLPKIRDYHNEILKRATLVTRHDSGGDGDGETAEL
jgi:hypothetical protein